MSGPGGRAEAAAAAQMVVRRAEQSAEERAKAAWYKRAIGDQASGMTAPMHLTNPVHGKYYDYALRNLKLVAMHRIQGIRENQHLGETLALCGAGPSLATEAIHPTDQVWGCNSAVNWLADNGYEPTGAIAIDQTERMLDDWSRTPDCVHMIASTVDPALTRHLIEQGKDVRVFHNYLGWDHDIDEIEFYTSNVTLKKNGKSETVSFPPSFMMGAGQTVLSRAVGLAAFAGFRRVDVYGADCAFVDGIAHANGETIEEAFGHTSEMVGELYGRKFSTRPDMLICATDLVRLVRMHPGRIRLMGDTLPVHLLGHEDEFLDKIVQRVEPGWSPPEGD